MTGPLGCCSSPIWPGTLYVAFGKLASNSLQAFYNLMAVFPVMTIPLLLGGLAGAEIFRMILTLLATLTLSLTVGLLVSTWSQHDRKSQAGTLFLMLGLTGVFPAIVLFLKRHYHVPLPTLLCAVSPGYTIAYADDTSFKSGPGLILDLVGNDFRAFMRGFHNLGVSDQPCLA